MNLTNSAEAPASTTSTPTQAPTQTPPWNRGWFYVAPGETPVMAWLLAIHVFTIVGAFVAPSFFPSWKILFASWFICFLGTLGVTVVLHRALSHKALKIHPVIEQFFIFFAMLNGFGTPLTWVASHRSHHRASDTVTDVSSPLHGGFWWSQLRWIYQAGQRSADEFCPDLVVKRRYRFWNPLQIPILLFSLFGGLLLGPTAWLWLGPIRLVYAIHAVSLVNSICHMSDTKTGVDYSRNLAWLTPVFFGQGENWHRNHHVKPLSAKFGQHWWQVDIGWNFIRLLEFVGLASDLKYARNR